MKIHLRITVASSHLLIGLTSITGALLALYQAPENFGSLQIIIGDIYFSDTVFDHFSQLFLLGIFSFYTMISSFYRFRLWQLMTAVTACSTLMLFGKIIDCFSVDYGVIIFILCMFQLLVSVLFILQKLKSRAETG
ncbi:hypothetical protein A5886_001999 [Enterococcus sp. 8G7_MSG3316]|uniref:Uncharacterized protein n=1 Tax=Candidatus Enterococcus testudinis TaxID=1834191 RepID=A0A242A7Q7_9ENTE|nr:hypothetical protein [Enterococcus sp. 8G7_MSG3316]OTN76920.1 hypothetical protein A5886_001999 [Enterococcus sp. 8G7_MSG3316]